MSERFSAPAFIAFTGVDAAGEIAAMQALSRHFPIEWGVLVDDDRPDDVLFAGPDIRARLTAAPGLRLAAHVCGEQARRIANTPELATIDLGGFQRLQVNHGFSGSAAPQVENCLRFAHSRGLRAVLQCLESFPRDNRLDWLFDVSFGTGKSPGHWPGLPSGGPFCGYSGGIGAENVRSVLAAIAAPDGVAYWIDMESGVRTGGRFDLAKCEAVCRAVFP